MITFEVKGLKEMGEQLRNLPEKLARRALARAVFEGARVIRTEGRAKARVGTKTYKDWRGKTHRPGLLKKSGVMAKKMKTRDWRTTVIYGVGFSKLGWYGRFVERGKSKKHKQARHPFIAPLLEERGQEAVDALKRRLGEELGKIARETPGLVVK